MSLKIRWTYWIINFSIYLPVTISWSRSIPIQLINSLASLRIIPATFIILKGTITWPRSSNLNIIIIDLEFLFDIDWRENNITILWLEVVSLRFDNYWTDWFLNFRRSSLYSRIVFSLFCIIFFKFLKLFKCRLDAKGTTIRIKKL